MPLAQCARSRPGGNVEFTTTGFAKRGSYESNAKPNRKGIWNRANPKGKRERRVCLRFQGDDLLKIVYSEGGWPKVAVEKQEMRQPPEHFGSDGCRNMWSLRRKK